MDDKMMSQLQELIKVNLPEATAGALKKYLAESEKLREENTKMLTELHRLDKLIETGEKEFDELEVKMNDLELFEEDNIDKKTALDKREMEIIKKEVRQEILEIRAAEADGRADLAKELVAIVFKNRTIFMREDDNGPGEINKAYWE